VTFFLIGGKTGFSLIIEGGTGKPADFAAASGSKSESFLFFFLFGAILFISPVAALMT
jgi:hypothetical protein